MTPGPTSWVRTSILRAELADFTNKTTTDQGRCTCAYGPVDKERKSKSIHRQGNYKEEVSQAVSTEFLAEWKGTELLKELKKQLVCVLLAFCEVSCENHAWKCLSEGVIPWVTVPTEERHQFRLGLGLPHWHWHHFVTTENSKTPWSVTILKCTNFTVNYSWKEHGRNMTLRQALTSSSEPAQEHVQS